MASETTECMTRSGVGLLKGALSGLANGGALTFNGHYGQNSVIRARPGEWGLS